MTQEDLLIKLDEETKALEKFIQDANSEIAFRRGRIAVLTDLINTTKGEADDHSQPTD